MYRGKRGGGGGCRGGAAGGGGTAGVESGKMGHLGVFL